MPLAESSWTVAPNFSTNSAAEARLAEIIKNNKSVTTVKSAGKLGKKGKNFFITINPPISYNPPTL
jgi:hypothetical protein